MDSEKSWRRRLRSPTKHALLLSVVVAQCAAAQPTDTTNAEKGFATLEAFLDGVRSLTADFKQELWNADQRLLQTDSGSLSLKRPNRFRWTYDEPTELVVAADGMRLWIYDVELAQVTVAPFDDTVGASPAMLLSGDRNVREEFEVVETRTTDGLDWVKLAPRTGGSDFASVLIGFSGTAPRRLELVDGLGQVTRIELDNLDINPALADGLFELDVPAGVDVIGGEG
jgi:outer membrane lipoprotein carrier protein